MSRVLEPVWVPMSDGCRLRGRVWLPDAGAPVPAVLEYLPYRLGDFTARRDATTHPELAARGIAGVRVDMRGSGDSEGLLHGEYLAQEHDDALEVIAWIAAQPWCDGNVGMMGISWGGFNALQVAARRPEALRGIVTVCSTDDRYADDVHYVGGCLSNENLGWASTMLAYQARPPDPAIVGDGWREIWRERLEALEPWVIEWMRHPLRDDFWKHGSVCEDPGAIECPVWAVGGWADGYSNAVFRLMRELPVPVSGMIGPWAHAYPHIATPGPTADFVGGTARFLARPSRDGSLTLFVQDGVPPARSYRSRAGRWVRFASWPDERIGTRRLGLGEGALVDGEGAGTHRVRSSQTVGLTGPAWCPYGKGPELAGDQQDDDAGSMVFDAEPLSEALTLVGAPVVELEVASDRPVAFVAARLCDVHPDGRSTLVSFGVRNLTHDDAHERVEPLTPGEPVRVRLALNDIAYRLAEGHRIRLALSSALWPMIWPSPEPVELTVDAGRSHVELPVLDEARVEPVDVAPAPEPARLATTTLSPPVHRREVVRHDDGVVELVLQEREHVRLDDASHTIGKRRVERYRIRPDDPLSACAEVAWEVDLSGPGFVARGVSRTVLSSPTTGSFRIVAELETFDGDEPFVSRTWADEIPRSGR